MNQEQLRELQQEQLKSRITLKVSEKGCLLICGMRTLPIAIYRNEFDAIMDLEEVIRGFIRVHHDELKDRI